MEHVQLSLALEKTFRQFSTEIRFTRDAFQNDPKNTIESALAYLSASKVITDGEHSDWCVEMNFADKNLKSILENDALAKMKICDLLAFLNKCYVKLIEENGEKIK
ncbi:MAG: hypothetical protein IJC38_10315 [Erysipelotrichaceae bacterium]|nr:hypothetical protein [Erysipelotrichaceae bacterium]